MEGCHSADVVSARCAGLELAPLVRLEHSPDKEGVGLVPQGFQLAVDDARPGDAIVPHAELHVGVGAPGDVRCSQACAALNGDLSCVCTAGECDGGGRASVIPATSLAGQHDGAGLH
jgi:hypothetical protein